MTILVLCACLGSLTTWYLADPFQPGVTVKWCGVERNRGLVVDQVHKQVFQGAPHCLVGTWIICSNIIVRNMVTLQTGLISVAIEQLLQLECLYL